MVMKIDTRVIGVILAGLSFLLQAAAGYDEIVKKRQIDIPVEYLQRTGKQLFGGDIRIGDISGNGVCDFIVYRSIQGGDIKQHEGGIKPCFMAAFDIDGKPLWQQGEGGQQPVRPGPVCVYDFDGDGSAEIACLWYRPDEDNPTNWLSLADVVFQIRDGKTGNVLRERAIPEIISIRTDDPKLNDWPHQRILVANFRGLDRPRDMVMKAGDTYVAITDQLDVLWTYQYNLEDESHKPPKFPAVGDMDGDHRDEVHGGYFLLSPDGIPFWTREQTRHMDSVVIDVWDSPNIRAISSGTPQVMGFSPEPILALGDEIIPHGQELKVANFLDSSPGVEMVIRNRGHHADVVLVSNQGKVLKEFELNEVPNNTGMESIHLYGPDKPAFLSNGQLLWDLEKQTSIKLPGLPPANGMEVHRMAFYHAIPADLTGDRIEDLVTYDPTSTSVYVFSIDAQGNTTNKDNPFIAGPRQFNPRLMD